MSSTKSKNPGRPFHPALNESADQASGGETSEHGVEARLLERAAKASQTQTTGSPWNMRSGLFEEPDDAVTALLGFWPGEEASAELCFALDLGTRAGGVAPERVLELFERHRDLLARYWLAWTERLLREAVDEHRELAAKPPKPVAPAGPCLFDE